MSRNRGQLVVITGASSGIGLAACRSCLAADHRVIATARSPSDLDHLARLGAEPVALELADDASIREAAARIRHLSGGRIDALFNNAGYGLQVALEDATPVALRRQLDVNVVGPVSLTNALLDLLGRGSRLVFNSSVLGVCVVPFRGPYCMSKHALEAACDAYRLELAGRGIEVYAIQPGPIEADFRAHAHRAVVACLQGRETRLDYRRHLARLQAAGASQGSAPAEAVAAVFLAIVEGRRRRSRYRVTRTAHLAAAAKRLLGVGFDRLALRAEPVTERRPGEL